MVSENLENIEDGEIRDIMSDTSAYVDSKEFFSWERFFTDLLVQKSGQTYLQYNKRCLNRAYLQDKIKNKILNSIHLLK